MERPVMERPVSLKVIAALFFLVAAYLVVIGIAEFVSPGTLAMTRATGITYGRELDGPQTAISIGAGGALVGGGVYRLHRWARWGASAFLGGASDWEKRHWVVTCCVA